MFCENCGKEVNEDDVFCSNCGCNLQEDKSNKTLIEQEIEKDFEKLDSKYTKNKIVLLAFIPIFLLILFFSTLNFTSSNSSYKIKEFISKLELNESQQNIENIFESIGINTNFITKIDYDEMLKGNFVWEQSNFENTNGTEKAYRITLSNGDRLLAYSENGKLLGIKIIDGDYLYANDKVFMKIDEAKILREQKYKELEEEINKKTEENKILKIGELKDIIGKQITINSVEFKKEVHPPKKDSYYNYYQAEDGQVYLHIVVSVKNLEKQAISQDEIMKVTADYNNGYTYSGFAVAEDNNLGFTYANIRNIAPLQTKNVHYLISVPEEVQNNKEASLFLKFKTYTTEYILNIR